MYCLDCNKLLNQIITYKNIFKVEKDHICERCFMNRTFIQRQQTIPINNYLIHLNTLFDDYDNPLSMMSFLKPYYLFYLKIKNESIIMYFNTFNKEVLDVLTKLNLSNIFLIVLKNELEEENEYEDWNYW